MNGTELRQRRKAVGLRQKELAKAMGVRKETLCRWEKRDAGGFTLPAWGEKLATSIFNSPSEISLIKAGRPIKPGG